MNQHVIWVESTIKTMTDESECSMWVEFQNHNKTYQTRVLKVRS